MARSISTNPLVLHQLGELADAKDKYKVQIRYDGKLHHDADAYEQQAFLERLEDLEDTLLAEQVLAEGGETIPHDIVQRLDKGDPPLLVWREHRGLSREDVAQASGVDVSVIAAIEEDRREATPELRERFAPALRCDPEDLEPWRMD